MPDFAKPLHPGKSTLAKFLSLLGVLASDAALRVAFFGSSTRRVGTDHRYYTGRRITILWSVACSLWTGNLANRLYCFDEALGLFT
jgi:hypothetical protein